MPAILQGMSTIKNRPEQDVRMGWQPEAARLSAISAGSMQCRESCQQCGYGPFVRILGCLAVQEERAFHLCRKAIFTAWCARSPPLRPSILAGFRVPASFSNLVLDSTPQRGLNLAR